MGDPIVDLAQSCLPFIPVPREMLRGKPGVAKLVASKLKSATYVVCVGGAQLLSVYM